MFPSSKITLVLLCILLAHRSAAVPRPITQSRGLLDFLADKNPSPSPVPSSTPSAEDPSVETDEISPLQPTATPDFVSIPTQSITTPLPDSSIVDATPVAPTATPEAEQIETAPLETTPTPEPSVAVATPAPEGFITFDGDEDGSNFEDEFEEEQDGDSSQQRAAPPTSVFTSSTGGLSAAALVAIALAVIAPAILIYWGIRRRNSGFQNMPAATAEANTYRGQGVRDQFSVDDE